MDSDGMPALGPEDSKTLTVFMQQQMRIRPEFRNRIRRIVGSVTDEQLDQIIDAGFEKFNNPSEQCSVDTELEHE